MRAERLFLHRFDQATALATSLREEDLLDLASNLRWGLLDKHSLADVANPNKIPLKFTISEFIPISQIIPTISDSEVIVQCDIDSLDVIGMPSLVPRVTLGKDNFLKHTVLMTHGERVSVKDTILYASNVLGGWHFDPNDRKPELASVKALSEAIELQGLPFAVRLIRYDRTDNAARARALGC